jgi:hypothetical protein
MPTDILSSDIWLSLLQICHCIKVLCHFVNLPLNQWTFGQAFDRCATLSKCSVIVSTCHYANYHFVNCHLYYFVRVLCNSVHLSLCQLTFWQVPFCQAFNRCVILSVLCHFINLSLCQLPFCQLSFDIAFNG